MGKGCKVVVCGLTSVGKTAILEQLLYGNHTAGQFRFLITVYYCNVHSVTHVYKLKHLCSEIWLYGRYERGKPLIANPETQ